MNLKIVTDYIDAINTADVDSICELLTEDHIFIDSQGNSVTGIDNLRNGWTQYFALFPDYKIDINETFEKGPIICLLGHASGTYKNIKNENNSNYWRIPAAFTAIVRDNKIRQWQVYADNIIVMEIINKNK